MMGAVIFDMDGVLVDSEAMYQYLLLDFFKKQGQHITVREANAFVGCSDSFFYRHMGMLWKPRLTEADMRKLFFRTFWSAGVELYNVIESARSLHFATDQTSRTTGCHCF